MSSKLPSNPSATLDQQPSLKAFALADILSLASGLLLSRTEELHALVGFVAGTAPGAENTAVAARDAKEALEEQLPFLKSVDYTLLHAAFREDRAHINDRIALWLDAQTRRYGAEHHVMPLSRWQRRRNSHKL